MNPSEARQHLEMAERIVADSTRHLPLCAVGLFFVIWGLFGGSCDLVFDLWRHQVLPSAALWSLPALLVVAVVGSILYGRYLGEHRTSLTFLHREFLTILGVTIGVTWLAAWGAWRLFPGFSTSALWSVAGSIVLFYIAFHANRRALAGGIILLASLIAANFMANIEGYILAGGMFLGYAGFGLAEMLARD